MHQALQFAIALIQRRTIDGVAYRQAEQCEIVLFEIKDI